MTGNLLIPTLTGPLDPTRLAPREWERLLSEARHSLLLARLAVEAKAKGWFAGVPEQPRRHLDAAFRSSRSQAHSVRWELVRIEQALAKIGAPVILLKGAAYVMADLAVAEGRVFGDIDIMVPRACLKEAEKALIAHGWISNVFGYDRRYYETWMHELPALHHVQRLSVIDLHHTIAPPTSRTPVDARKLFAAARPLDGTRFLHVLAPTDMLLHSALHLMQEGEFQHGLRDLVDLDGLFRDFGRDSAFWPALVERAAELGLGRPLYYVAHQARSLLQTPMPGDFVAAVEGFRPGLAICGIMDRLLGTALAGPPARGRSREADLARWLLYVRGHYLRMPLSLLIPHLVRKSGMRLATLGRGRTDQSVPAGGERAAN